MRFIFFIYELYNRASQLAITIHYEIQEAKTNPIIKGKCAWCNEKVHMRKKELNTNKIACSDACFQQLTTIYS